MDEKTLLAEIEKEQKKKIEEKFLEQKGSVSSESTTEGKAKPETKVQSEPSKKKREPSVFSSKTLQNTALTKKLEKKYVQLSGEQFEEEPTEEPVYEPEEYAEDETEKQTLSASEPSTIIERPNYDFIEELSPEQREKIFKIEEQEKKSETKPKTSKIKSIVIAILFAIFGVWGIINIATLDSLGGQISDISTEYDMNLISYLNNLHNLDATNGENMENLFQTIPKDDVPPSSIGEQSNWFDRFCNFIAGLFGG